MTTPTEPTTESADATPPEPKPKRGFAAMDPKAQRKLAQQGGRKAHANGTAHKFTKDEARAAGIQGGQKTSQDREHMAEIGRKGGASVSKNLAHMSAIGKKGGTKSAQDREHMKAIASKGGHAKASAQRSNEEPTAPTS